MSLQHVREFRSTDLKHCRSIFDALPEWFGIPEAVEDYLAGLGERPTWVATHGNDVVGFLAVEVHAGHAAEVWVAAVHPDHHRNGPGRRLVRRAEQFCRDRALRYLQVKTLAPARESAAYAATREFWLDVGFVPLETFPELWNPFNPALQLVKTVPRHSVESLVDALGLEPHPEGGYFRETWRSDRVLDLSDYDGPRNAATSIHFRIEH